MTIDVREMRQVAAIASEGSFAGAAKVLHMSQPALSRSIQEVERKAGFRLFDRGRDGAMLTDAGRAFMQQASDILALADGMERELALIKGLDTGDLFIGAGVYVSDMFVGEALAPFARFDTKVRIRLLNDLPDVLIHRLRRREVDIVVADPAWLNPATEIKQITLSRHQGYLVVRHGHPLLGRRNLAAGDLVRYPLVSMPLMPNRIALMGQHLKGAEAGVHKLLEKWRPTIAVNSITSMKTIVADSDAITIVSLKMVRHELARRELVVLPLQFPWLGTNFAIMHLAHRTLSPLAEAVMTSIVTEDGNLLELERKLATRWLKKPAGRRGGR
ncbi:MAG TPA: LysR family transcriptional regulator [Kiritimatiellia bacterium]|nr:LysR family transcriptional regulator [Kiritimatiellia bacterium]HMO98182.1 LysR family transcriptional regulator [Kiritimatiellia bacterium]